MKVNLNKICMKDTDPFILKMKIYIQENRDFIYKDGNVIHQRNWIDRIFKP